MKKKIVMKSKLMSCGLRVQKKEEFTILRIPLRSTERHRLCTMHEMRLKLFYLDTKGEREHRKFKV